MLLITDRFKNTGFIYEFKEIFEYLQILKCF